MSKAILITSYYRSGTSALSGTLNLAGVDITRTDEHNEHNPRGYFENPALTQLDLKLFKRLGRDWHDIRLMPAQWWERPDVGADTQRIVSELRAKHGKSSLWAVKHPHLCRLLPIYGDAAKRVSGTTPGVIHIYRDPWVVAHSQYKKNGLSRAHALLLWSSYVLDGERYARELDRAVLDYELLVKDARQALQRIEKQLGIELPRQSTQDWHNISTFLTPHLRRSRAQGRDSTPQPVRELVQDIWECALEDGEPARFDALRTRFVDTCAFLDELAASRLAVTAELNTGFVQQRTGPEDTDRQGAEGSPLRPAERTDIAERQRLLEQISRKPTMPTVTVLIAVPTGRIEAAFDTARSIDRQWLAPQAVHYLCAAPDAPQRDGWTQVEPRPGALTRALSEHASESDTDYVAIIDAGDHIEPDACARLALFTQACDRPALVYTDEIVANKTDPWIRHKPDFDIERLRGLHYLGGWMWYRTDFLREAGSLNGHLVGAEDFDIALRAFDAKHAIHRMPEALYARAPDSRRDSITSDDVRNNAKNALSAHLQRNNTRDQIKLQEGAFPGAFTLRYQPVLGKRISLVLLCNEARGSQAADLNPERLIKVAAALNIDRVVCAAFGKRLDKDIGHALTLLSEHKSLGGCLRVVHAEREGKMLAEIARHVGDDTVVFLSLEADASDAQWLGHLQGKLFAQGESVGMVGVHAQYRDADGSRRLAGPLLLGGGEGVNVIGLGRDGDDPGPGGWLLGVQSVDGVAPPCLAMRGQLLKQLCIDTNLSGAALWLDVSLQIWQQGYSVIWDPSVRVTCPKAPAYTQLGGNQMVEGNRTLRRRWGCASPRHHPMLALRGDSLRPMANAGLCAPAPRSQPYALLSGPVDGAEYAVEWLRAARISGELTAGWSTEPIASTEICRLAPDAWLRVNPDSPVSASEAPPWQALFTRPPAESAPLRTIGEQAQASFATSPTLVEALQKRSYNRLRPQFLLPRLPARLWSEFSAAEPVGRHQIRVLWVDEGDPPDWIVELLNLRQVAWFVVQGGERRYDGPIATLERPSDENGWYELFRSVVPHLLIRPARDATWMDSQLLLRGAAAGAALFADTRLHWPESLPVTPLPARFDNWRRALERAATDTEALLKSGQSARAAVDALGWLEDQSLTDMLLAPPNAHSRVRHAG